MFTDSSVLDTALTARQLRRARESLALSLDRAARQAEVDPADLRQWESGTAEPPLDALWQLAELYGRATEYFVRDIPEPPAHIKFRITRPGRGLRRLSTAARKALVQFEELCRKHHELQELVGSRTTLLFPEGTGLNDPEAAASRVRSLLGRHQDPVPNLRDLLEGTGVHVFEIPVEQSEFAGFSWWHPAYGPCIMVNARDALGRRNFTMAHEYAHLIAKSGPSLCDLSLVTGPERFADRFAAALLVPESDLRAQWERRGYCGSGLTLGQVDALARRYGCSAEAIARRLRELELIAKATRDRILDETHKRLIYRRRGKAPPWTKRLGAHYISLASKAYSTGRISVGKLAECLGISVAEAAQISRTR